MDRGLGIKKTVFILLLTLLLLSSGCIRENNSIRKIGNHHKIFENTKLYWKMNYEYKNLQNSKPQNYLLYELGTWSHNESFMYFLLDLDTNRLASNQFYHKITMPQAEVNEIIKLFENVNARNNIYDGVNLYGETVCFIEYVNRGKNIEFGILRMEYSEEMYAEQKIPRRIRELCRQNIKTTKKIEEIFFKYKK